MKFKFLLFIVFLLICFAFGNIFKFDLENMRSFLSSFPIVVSGIVFVALYVILTFFIWFGPKDVFRVSGAILFGPYVSTVLVFISEMINAGILFLVSRKLGQEYVQKKFRLKRKQIEKTKNFSGFFGIFVLRINPLIPFRLQDLASGLSQISIAKYLAVIAAPTYFRILWLQVLLAGLGTSIFKNPEAVIDFLMAHPIALKINFLYFFIVVVLTVTAVIWKIVEGIVKAA